MKTQFIFGLLIPFLLLVVPIKHIFQHEEVDVTQFVELERIGRGSISDMNISPDGNFLALASEHIWIYDLSTLTVLEVIETELHGYWQVAWSPDGQRLAASATDTLVVWATNSWQEEARFEMENLLPLLSIAWSPDSRYLVFPGLSPYDPNDEDGYLNNPSDVYVWDTINDELAFQLSGLTAQIMSVSWSPDGSKIAAGNEIGDIRVWGATTGNPLNLEAPQVYGRVWTLEWSPNSEILAISAADSDTILWDLQQVQTSFEYSSYNAIAWSPDGSQIAGTFSGHLGIWNLEEEVFSHMSEEYISYVYDIVWSPDDSLLVTAGLDGALRVWDTNTWQVVMSLDEHLHRISALAWSPDATQIVFAQESLIKIWDLDAQSFIATLNDHRSHVRSIQWSPELNLLASSDNDGNVFIWDAEDYTLARSFTNAAWVLSMEWSPNGDYLAYASGPNVFVRETVEWELIAEFTPQDNYGHEIRWSPDSAHLATYSWPNIEIWDTATWQLIATTSTVQANDFAWSPDSQFIASANYDGITIWDSQTGELNMSLAVNDVPSNGFSDISWASVGRQLISVADTGEVQVWSFESGELLHTLPLERNSFQEIVWSPDGNKFAVNGMFGSISIWGIGQ